MQALSAAWLSPLTQSSIHLGNGIAHFNEYNQDNPPPSPLLPPQPPHPILTKACPETALGTQMSTVLCPWSVTRIG